MSLAPPDQHTESPRRTSRRSVWAAVGAAIAVTIGAVAPGAMPRVDATLSAGAKPAFVPITPCRLFDTRPEPEFNVGPRNTPLGAKDVFTFTVRGNTAACPSTIAGDAVGLVLNVTAVGATQETFVTIWGGGAQPPSSNLNPAPGQPPTPNAVTTPLDGNGAFRVFNNVGQVHVLADVVGYFVDHNHDDLYFRKTELYTQDEVNALLAPLATKAEVGTKASQAAVDAVDAKTVAAPVTTRFTYLTTATAATDDISKLRTIGTFVKARSDSTIRIDWSSMVSESTALYAGCRYHFRVNDLPSATVLLAGNPSPAVTASMGQAGTADVRVPMSLTDYFTGLPAGSHTVSLWSEDASLCTENSGGFVRTVFVTEMVS